MQKKTFILDYGNLGYKEEIKRQIIDMAMNGSGVRDTSRVLKISKSSDILELTKKKETDKHE